MGQSFRFLNISARFEDNSPLARQTVERVDGEFSFSGQETAIRRMAEQGTAPATVARAVEHTIAKTMKKVFQELFATTGVSTVLLAGGVMCNGSIKNYLREQLPEASLYFADPRYASDNAVGVAALTLQRFGGTKK